MYNVIKIRINVYNIIDRWKTLNKQYIVTNVELNMIINMNWLHKYDLNVSFNCKTIYYQLKSDEHFLMKLINLKTQINEEKSTYMIIINEVANEHENEKWDLNWKLKTFEMYWNLAKTFNDQKVNFLSFYHEANLTIEIIFDQIWSFEFLYKFSRNELKAY